MKGKGFLKVTGILMIIFGAIALLVNIIAVVGLAAAAILGIGIGVAVFGLIISLISAAIELITGILGVKYCDDASKAKTCMIWGIVVAALCVIGHIITAVGGGDFGLFGLLCGLVIPVLYIIGAKKNMNSACAAPVCEEAPAPAEEIPPVSEPVAEENSSVEDTPTEE